MNEKEKLKNQIKNTLIQLYCNDWDIINRGVHEQCISAHFWYYFKRDYEEYYKGLDIDIEYNKNSEDLKFVETGRSVRPDMIIHKRKSMEHNLLCVEFKKSSIDIEEDCVKLKKITSKFNIEDRYTYRYKYGVSIVINKNKKPILTWFEDGIQGENEEIDLSEYVDRL